MRATVACSCAARRAIEMSTLLMLASAFLFATLSVSTPGATALTCEEVTLTFTATQTGAKRSTLGRGAPTARPVGL